MEKWIAAFLQIAAAILLFVAGAISDEESLLLLVPALIAGVAGLLLWSRERTAPAPPIATRVEPPPLEAKVHRIEDTLFALQAEIAHLREDREFFSELYAERAERPSLKS